MVKFEDEGICSQRVDLAMFGLGDDAPLLHYEGFIKIPVGPSAI